MADKILKSITFPNLPDKYIIPETTVDSVPTQGSTNAVSSGGVYDALTDKADKDSTPETVTPTETDADFYLSDANGNVLLELADGHIKTKEFDSSDINTETDTTLNVRGKPADAKAVGDAISAVEDEIPDTNKLPEGKLTTAQNVDLDVTDANGNVLLRLADGHIRTKNFDSSRSDQNAVLTVNNTAPDANGNVNVRAELDPEDIAPAVEDYLDEHPVVASGGGVVSVADYDAVGDGVTDDSPAIQNAVNSNYDVYFESDKTYYLASTVTINHDIKLHGGKNTVIKTKSVNGIGYDGIVINGTLKLTTTLTSDYTSKGYSTDCAGHRLSLASIAGIEIGDVIRIVATDQYYSYARQYYYLGGVFKVVDIYNGYVYIDRPMPWDITNTSNVSVKVYNAPKVQVCNLMFEGDTEPWESGVYQAHRLLGLEHCADSDISDCVFSKFTIGLSLMYCVNSRIDGVTLSKSKYDNTLVGDGYAITVNSCTNTVIQRMLSLCSQACLDLTGTIPCIDTFVSKCSLASESRPVGIGIHENSYNLVVEDCVLAGMNAYGTVTVNRCRFVRNNRVASASDNAIVMRGSHNPEWARTKIKDCDFGEMVVMVRSPAYQNGIQAADYIIDLIDIENCTGGAFNFNTSVDSNVLSNTVNTINLDNWKDCQEVYHPSTEAPIKLFKINECSFINAYFINAHRDGMSLSGIEYLDYRNTYPLGHKISVDKDTRGEKHVLREGTSIAVSSSNANAKYIVCGANLVSDNVDDYRVGYVTGNTGSALSREVATQSGVATVSINNGNLVYTQQDNTSSYAIYPVGMFYVAEDAMIEMSATLKNTGATDGATFRPMIAVVNCKTGLVTYRGNGTAVKATTDGASISHSRYVPKDSVVMCYYYCNTPVSNAVTEFEDFTINMQPVFGSGINRSGAYTAMRLTGDGTLTSLDGENNIMSSESVFHVSLVGEV